MARAATITAMTIAQAASLVMAGTALLTSAGHAITALTGLVRRVSALERQLAAVTATSTPGPPAAASQQAAQVATPADQVSA